MRNAPSNGPTSSDAWNDSFTELATDLANISVEWNNKVTPILLGLPYGSASTTIDAYKNGLDAKNMWVDQNASNTDDDLTYYHSANNRPVTVYEAFVDVYEYVNAQIDSTTITLLEQAAALSTGQKDAIGINIFDSTQASSASSLDGKSENNRLNIIQLAKDTYGAGYALGNDGNQDLTYTVMEMVDALLTLHNGNWHDDIGLSHTGISTVQTSVNSSSPGNDSYGGSPTTLEDDLNEVRTKIKNLKGTAAWTSALTALYAGGADSLEELLTTTAGSGTKDVVNPWGYHYDDIDALSTALANIHTYTGMDDAADTTPTYSGNNIVSNGQPLEVAISLIDIWSATVDSGGATVSGQVENLATFVGQDSASDSTPDYSSTTVVDAYDSLETAIGKLDVPAGLALLTDGTRPMVAGLNMGAQNITHVDDLGVIDDITASGDITAAGTVSGLLVHAADDLTASGMIRSENIIEAGDDVEVTNSGAGVILTSPDGTRWRLQIDNAGDPTTTAL